MSAVPSVSALISKYTPAELEIEICQMVGELFTFLSENKVKPEQGGEFFVSISYVDADTVKAKQLVHEMAKEAKRSGVQDAATEAKRDN